MTTTTIGNDGAIRETGMTRGLILLGLALCAAAVPAQAQITFRAASSATATGTAPAFRAATSAATTGTTLNIGKPAGVAANDMLIASIGVRPSSASLTPPAGWILVRRVDNASDSSNSLAVYRKLAGASEPASYSWSVGGASATAGGIQAFFGVDTANPIAYNEGHANASSLTHDTPAVFTPVANTMKVASHTFASSASWSVTPDMTESFDIASGAAGTDGQSIVGSRGISTTAGTIGAVSATASNDADAGNTHILGLQAPSLTAFTLDKPAGTAPNDVLIASIAVRSASVTLGAPAGWTLLRRVDNTVSSSSSLAVYRKVAGASEPSSYSWALDAGATFVAGGIQGFVNVDTANPIDVESGQTTALSLTHATPSVTTTVPNAMLVATHTFPSAATWTPPADMSESFDVATPAPPNQGGLSIEGSRVVQPAPGATGAKTATASNDADDGITHILALRPSNAAPTVNLTMYFIQTDHLNTPRMVANQAGTTVWRWDNTEPFGNSMPNDDPDGDGVPFVFDLRFPGQYFDRETNLAYNYRRDYDSAIGRYVQSDPIGLRGGINTYAYVGANPLKWIDRKGLAAITIPLPDIPLPSWISIPGSRALGLVGLILSLSGDTSCSPRDEEGYKKCVQDCTISAGFDNERCARDFKNDPAGYEECAAGVLARMEICVIKCAADHGIK